MVCLFVFMSGLTFMQRRSNEIEGPSIKVPDPVDVFNECTNNRTNCNETPQRATVSPLFLTMACLVCLSEALSVLADYLNNIIFGDAIQRNT